MTYRSSIIVVLLLGFLALRSFSPKPIADDKEGLIVYGVMSFLNQVHYQPKPVDDNFSKAVYKTFMERLDPNKRYLTEEDIKVLATYETKIDDEIQSSKLEFFNKANEIITKRMLQTRTYYDELVKEEYNFERKDFIELDGEKLPYAKNDKELKERWSKFMKYEILSRFERKLYDQNKPDFDGTKKTDKELVEEARTDLQKTFGDWFVRMDKVRRSDRFETFLSSITNYFDPHSEYFNPKEKEDFDINMGGKLQGIGARLSQDGDYVRVSEIIVGGPAWKGKELDVDDLIRAVTQKGEKPMDITGMRLDDVVQKIRGKVGTTVILDVKKKDGSLEKIEIVREEVIIDESFAKSSVIDIPGQINKIGYIYLPKFYSSFEAEGGNSCAVDVAKEIEKLKAENVNGIILDLRNNSGGSLSDVVDMSGLFIEKGPIVQVKSREGSPYVYSDKDPSVSYTGPLIVMVNHFSASASEILAAAMQDYGRAIIVGSPTFGKGTVQRFYDLDKVIRGNEELKPLGSVKMTMQKFFRINGGSTQHKGVIPDIELPDSYKYMGYGEKEYDYALDYTEIPAQKYTQEIVSIEHMDKLKLMSESRVKANKSFQLIEENAQRFKKNKDITKYPIDLKSFSQMMKDREQEDKKFDNIAKDDITDFTVRNLSVDKEQLKVDEGKKSRNDEWINGLKKDIYLYETMVIMKDMIEQEKSFTTYVEKIKE